MWKTIRKIGKISRKIARKTVFCGEKQVVYPQTYVLFVFWAKVFHNAAAYTAEYKRIICPKRQVGKRALLQVVRVLNGNLPFVFRSACIAAVYVRFRRVGKKLQRLLCGGRCAAGNFFSCSRHG